MQVEQVRKENETMGEVVKLLENSTYDHHIKPDVIIKLGKDGKLCSNNK